MKRIALMLFLAAFILPLAGLAAQERTKSQEADKSVGNKVTVTPLRVQVVFMEFEGERRIGSMPYTLLVNADDTGPIAAVRMGLRVPIVTSSNTGVKQLQYVDLGTNLDGRAEKTEDGRFLLKLNVEKSSAYSPGSDQKAASVEGAEINKDQPVIQQFRSQVNLLIRDGQTLQSTVATDPVTGHVLKVEVSLNVLK